MLSIQNSILCSNVFKFVGFDSLFICTKDELQSLIQTLRCCMVISNPAQNAYGFMQQFLSQLHVFSTDLLYRAGFNKDTFKKILGDKFSEGQEKEVDLAYSELMQAMQSYSELLLDKSEVYTVYNVASGDFEIKVKPDDNVFLVIPTIISKNARTGKQSFRILDSSVNKVVDYVEYLHTAYIKVSVYERISKSLFGVVKSPSSDDITHRVIRTVNNKFSGFLGYMGISASAFNSLNAVNKSGNLRLKLCHHMNIKTRELKSVINRYKHSCASVVDVEKEIGAYPWDSFLYSYNRCSNPLDRDFGSNSKPVTRREYINGDSVTFYTQVVTDSSIGYSEIKPCEQCKYFMNRISTNPRCTFMSAMCEVSHVESGITAWKNIRYTKEK